VLQIFDLQSVVAIFGAMLNFFFKKKSEKKFASLEKGSTFASANEITPYLFAQR